MAANEEGAPDRSKSCSLNKRKTLPETKSGTEKIRLTEELCKSISF